MPGTLDPGSAWYPEPCTLDLVSAWDPKPAWDPGPAKGLWTCLGPAFCDPVLSSRLQVQLSYNTSQTEYTLLIWNYILPGVWAILSD